MGKQSRDKGRRGEQEIARKLHGKRVGVAFAGTPVDVKTAFADYQVKNRPVGSGAILVALEAMGVPPVIGTATLSSSHGAVYGWSLKP